MHTVPVLALEKLFCAIFILKDEFYFYTIKKIAVCIMFIYKLMTFLQAMDNTNKTWMYYFKFSDYHTSIVSRQWTPHKPSDIICRGRKFTLTCWQHLLMSGCLN